jgi:hypothetical protein
VATQHGGVSTKEPRASSTVTVAILANFFCFFEIFEILGAAGAGASPCGSSPGVTRSAVGSEEVGKKDPSEPNAASVSGKAEK